MKQILAWGILLAITPWAAANADPALYNMSVKDVPVENGKALDMSFDELSRTADSSVVQITRRSGGSVSSSMFVMRGMCALTRLRDAQYFVAERMASDAGRYTVTFLQAPPDARTTGFSLAQCDLMRL